MGIENLNEGASRLLVDVCQTVLSVSGQFVVVGGWCPFLRGGNEKLKHPGTRDVDLLFNNDVEIARQAVKALFKVGFIPSAKHEFQLLKTVSVLGKTFIYNVDILLPNESVENPDMFNDILDLGIPERVDSDLTRHVRSIALPSAAIVFREKLWSNFPAPSLTTMDIPLLNEAGLIITKARSIRSAKRPRDAFDIFYVLTGPKSDEILAKLAELRKADFGIREEIDSLLNYVSEHKNNFDHNVRHYAGNFDFPEEPYVTIRKLLTKVP